MIQFGNLSGYGIQGHLHTWFKDFLDAHSQQVTLNRILSSPLPVKAGVAQGRVLSPVLMNDFSDSLENPLDHFVEDSTLCCNILHPSDRQRQQPLHSLQNLIESRAAPTLAICISILKNLTLSLYLYLSTNTLR